jgi:UDPglucose 6-dehydrogenase
VKIGRDHGVDLSLIRQTIDANERQKLWMVKKIKETMDGLEGKVLGILGITFKAETDDMREAPSLVILQALVKEGAKLNIYDPQGEKEGKWRLESIKGDIMFCANEYDAANEVDALVILTDWAQFKTLDMDKIFTAMNGKYFFDFRNMFEKYLIEKKGFLYFGTGK